MRTTWGCARERTRHSLQQINATSSNGISVALALAEADSALTRAESVDREREDEEVPCSYADQRGDRAVSFPDHSKGPC